MPSPGDIDVSVGQSPDDGSGNPTSPQVTIADNKGSRAWSGTGRDHSEAATEAVRKMLGDRRIREYLEH